MFEHLRYDKVDEVLYLVAQDFDVEELKDQRMEVDKKHDNP